VLSNNGAGPLGIVDEHSMIAGGLVQQEDGPNLALLRDTPADNAAPNDVVLRQFRTWSMRICGWSLAAP
jgi:hypothetical protein